MPSGQRKAIFAFPFGGGSRPGKRKDRVHLSVSGGGGRHEQPERERRNAEKCHLRRISREPGFHFWFFGLGVIFHLISAASRSSGEHPGTSEDQFGGSWGLQGACCVEITFQETQKVMNIDF